MLKIKARKLLQFTTDELWDILSGQFILVFDDGEELVTNVNRTLFSSYCWEFHREYPETPLLRKHHVEDMLTVTRLTSETHLNLLGTCMWDVHDKVIDQMPNPVRWRDRMAEKIYAQTNAIYNAAVLHMSEFVTSLDILDFIQVINHPDIRKANESAKPTQDSIDATYREVKRVLHTDPVLSHNPLALAVRSKIANDGQVNQCISIRGFLTEINSEVFRNPIMVGYAHGFTTLHDSMLDSRSAAKSLYYSKVPLEQVEYFNRRLQLMCEILQNLHHGDCGTTTYAVCRIEEGELPEFVGSNYLDEKTGKIKTIKATDRHLVGKVIKKRSVVHCAHPDPYGVCSVCYGELSLSVPENTNLGQYNCTHLARIITQSVLSLKHLDGSSVVVNIELDQNEQVYLKVGKDDSTYMLNPDLSKLPVVRLHAFAKDMKNLTDIHIANNIEALNITHYTELRQISISTVGEKGVDNIETLDIGLDHRPGSFTYEFLRHIQKTNWTFDEKGNYIFDMSGWDWNRPIIKLPMRQHNMLDFAKSLAKQLESSVKELEQRENVGSPDASVMAFFRKVNSKLKVNIAVIEVVAYASMVVSTQRNNYTLPKPGSRYSLGIMDLTMSGRSIAPALAYEDHARLILSPESFVYTNRTDHLMDAIICPNILNNAR